MARVCSSGCRCASRARLYKRGDAKDICPLCKYADCTTDGAPSRWHGYAAAFSLSPALQIARDADAIPAPMRRQPECVARLLLPARFSKCFSTSRWDIELALGFVVHSQIRCSRREWHRFVGQNSLVATDNARVERAIRTSGILRAKLTWHDGETFPSTGAKPFGSLDADIVPDSNAGDERNSQSYGVLEGKKIRLRL